MYPQDLPLKYKTLADFFQVMKATRLGKFLAIKELDDCWFWQGTTGTASGYGACSWKGRSAYTHRLFYELAKGPLLSGKVIMHLCHNRPCCNPTHLRQGTYSENTRHMWGHSIDPFPGDTTSLAPIHR